MAKINFKKLTEFCACILEIQKDPEFKEILLNYLHIAKAAQEGRLKLEGMERFKELNVFILQAVHRQCQAAQGGE